MNLAQIARYLGVDERDAHAALNRIGVVSPAPGDDSTIILLRDLQRALVEIEQRKRWATTAGNGRTN